MNGHSITIDFRGEYPHYTVTCHELPEAICRAKWSCDCEIWGASGVDEQGPWHDTYGYGDLGHIPERHRGSPGDDCGLVPFFDDGPEEYGAGEITLPVDIYWDGDDYAWRFTP